MLNGFLDKWGHIVILMEKQRVKLKAFLEILSASMFVWMSLMVWERPAGFTKRDYFNFYLNKEWQCL